jgi:hypothetical protein
MATAAAINIASDAGLTALIPAPADMEGVVDNAVPVADTANPTVNETNPAKMLDEISLLPKSDNEWLVPVTPLMLAFGGKSGPLHYRACETKGNQMVTVEVRGRAKYVPLSKVASFLACIYPNRDLAAPADGLPAFLETKGNMTPDDVKNLLEKARAESCTAKEKHIMKQPEAKEGPESRESPESLESPESPETGKSKSGTKPRATTSSSRTKAKATKLGETFVPKPPVPGTSSSSRAPTEEATTGKRKMMTERPEVNLLAAQVCKVVEEYSNTNGLTHVDMLVVAKAVLSMSTKRVKKTEGSGLLESALPQPTTEETTEQAIKDEGNMEVLEEALATPSS